MTVTVRANALDPHVAGGDAEEAEQRRGDTDAWKQQPRAAAYTKDDWIAIRREADGNIQHFADTLRAGEPAASDVAMDLAGAHCQHISRWFYDCGYGMHRGLAEMYIDAILANANRAPHRPHG